jgi:cell division transport system ATP-binding protein
LIHFKSIIKNYDKSVTLKDITFSVHRGEMAYIIGPSGAGKTTLLKLIYLEEWADEGSIIVDNEDIEDLTESEVPYFRRKIGVVFQDFKLLENRTIFENVALTLRIRNINETEIKHSVNDTLKMVGLRHKSDAYPLTLSGGEQQRVAIARAIIGNPAIVLADEPTGNLDPDTSASIIRIFKEINARGTTVLHATHNRDLFRGTGYRAFRLEDGRIYQEAGN